MKSAVLFSMDIELHKEFKIFCAKRGLKLGETAAVALREFMDAHTSEEGEFDFGTRL